LFLIAGVALLSATVLIPAQRDLDEAQWHAQRAVAVERYRTDRLERYSAFRDALDRRDTPLVLGLLQTQLHLSPVDRTPLVDMAGGGSLSGSVFARIEPRFEPIAAPEPMRSALGRLATGERSRLWLVVIGAVLMLVGLLPGGTLERAHAGR